MKDWEVDRVPVPYAVNPAPDRLRGMMLGLAIGDALGNTSEGCLQFGHEWYGEIRDYLPNSHAGERRVGLPSDDTQLAFWTLESLPRQDRLEPEDLAVTFSGSGVYVIGRTVASFLSPHRAGNRWEESGQPSAGNGALMPISPAVLPHLLRPGRSLWRDVVDGPR